MKLYYKTVLGLLAAAIILNVSCTKNTTPAKADNTAALSKQLAMDFYKSISSGITNGGKGLKTGSTSLKTFSGPNCGETVTTPVNITYASSRDTLVTLVGTDVFTYMCDGFYHNGVLLDAYIQKDTLTSTAAYPTNKLVNKLIFYYVVKSKDATYTTLGVNGTTSSDVTFTQTTGGTVTNYDNTTVNYTWDNINVDRTGPTNKFTAGVVTYNMKVTKRDATNSPDGIVNTFTGTLTFLPDNKIRTTMNNGTTTKTYVTNVLTGEVITE